MTFSEATGPRRAGVAGRAWAAYQRILLKLIAHISNGAGNLARRVFDRPRLTLCAMLAVVLLCCIGWVRLRFEDEAEIIWCVSALFKCLMGCCRAWSCVMQSASLFCVIIACSRPGGSCAQQI